MTYEQKPRPSGITALAILDAYGLWRGKSWARWMSVIFPPLGALASVFILPAG